MSKRSRYNLRSKTSIVEANNADTDEADVEANVDVEADVDVDDDVSIGNTDDIDTDLDVDEVVGNNAITDNDRLIKLLTSYADQPNKSKDDIKEEVIEEWLKDVRASKRRRLRDLAEKLYDDVSRVPTYADILISKMPFNEKILLLEQMQILSNLESGTHDFLDVKRGILKTLDGYEKMKEDSKELALIEAKELSLMPVHHNEPMKMRILKANISEVNRKILLEKYHALSSMSPHDTNRSKLHEWINWGLCINNNVIDLPIKMSDGALAINNYLYNVKVYLDSKLYGMVKVKERLLELLATRITNPHAKELAIGIVGPPGVGKCLHPDTNVLMYFGQMKSAKNIARGDILIGDDGNPRIVMSTTSGTDVMFKITPDYGDMFIVNKPHIITLYSELTGRTLDIPLDDYMRKDIGWQRRYKMFSVPVNYPHQAVPNDPFIIGILLGGNSRTIEDIMKEYLVKRLDCLSTYVNGISDLKALNLSTIDNNEILYLLKNRYIPDEYLYNSREVRFKLLQGLLTTVADKSGAFAASTKDRSRRSKSVERTPTADDINVRSASRHHRSKSQVRVKSTRGVSFRDLDYQSDNSHSNSYEASRNRLNRTAPQSSLDLDQKPSIRNSKLKVFQSKIPVLKRDEVVIQVHDKILGEQIKFLVRSLGFNCIYIHPEITIIGNVDTLPPIDKRILTDFKVECIGTGEYCGFTLDKNGRFLLSSCLVTHNTHLIQTFANAVSYPFVKINMGGSTDPHHFLGHSYTYEGAQPGVIVKALKQLGSKTGILYLDEFDKIGNDNFSYNKVANTFLHISDPVQQEDFQDEYLNELKIDLSYLLIAYSFNRKENVNPILLNRIPIIELAGYTPVDKMHIATNYIIPEVLKNVGMTVGDIKFDSEALTFIINNTQYDDKDGMRNVKQMIQSVINKINIIKTITHADGQLVLSYGIKNFKLPFTITKSVLDLLGFNHKKEDSMLSMYN